jgi:hypothetical protein
MAEKPKPQNENEARPAEQHAVEQHAPKSLIEVSQEQAEQHEVAVDRMPDIYVITMHVASGLPMHEGKKKLRAWIASMSPSELMEWKSNYRQRVERMSQAAEGLGQELMTLLG